MNPYTFHINLYDLAFLGVIFIAVTFSVLLWITPKINRSANTFLSLALMVVVLWLARVLGIDTGLSTYIPGWDRLPVKFLLALGPLIYFYVLKITRPEYSFRFREVLHFSPLLVEFGVQALEINESVRTGAATYNTGIFHRLNPALALPTFISVGAYLYWCHLLIKRYYTRLEFTGNDRYRQGQQWLHRWLKIFGLLWLLWIPFVVFDHFAYHDRMDMHDWYPLYLVLAVSFTRFAILSFLKAGSAAPAVVPPVYRPLQPAELKQKGAWLKNVVKANRYYQDEYLTLNSLAEKLDLSPHELSRIINTTLKKSFSDFINEYRVADVVRKMQDPAYDHITLLGIAFGSGFYSRTTFHRSFKQVTGKSPAEYKRGQKKEIPFYKTEQYSRNAPVISNHQATLRRLDEKLNRKYMFKIYLKSAWRHIIRHKTYSAINVMGLALGICGCLVIYVVTTFEFSFDTFHPDKDRIYCVDISAPNPMDGSMGHMNAVMVAMPAAMRNDMTGLEKMAAYQPYNPKVKIKESDTKARRFNETNAIIAQPDYFDILQYTWLSGSKKTALTEPMSVVLTQSRANTYFGNLPPAQMIGKTIIYDDSLLVRVTGILKDWNTNTDFNFSDFISFSTIRNSFLIHQFPQDKWDVITGTQVLLKLPKGVKPSQIDAQFPAFIKKYIDANPHTQMRIQLQPFTGIHFHQYGGPGRKADLPVLYGLSAVALFILLIAAINFINLSTAQSIQRTKEIGILKVLGSEKSNILFRFLTETFILALMAVAIALIAIKPLLNLFAAYIPAGVQFHFADYSNWLFLAAVAVFTTLLAGFYPARLLTAFKPVSSLKGKVSERAGNKGYLRKSLIVFQFTISLLFIIGTLAVGNQISYMQNKDLGIKTNDIITLPMVWRGQPGKLKVLADQVKQLPGVEQVITEGSPPVSRGHMGDPIRLRGPLEWSMDSYTYSSNEHFVPFYHMKIVAGRNLLHTDSATEYLINETAAKALGFRDPHDAIGKLLLWGPRNKGYPIAGVVADFYQSSFFETIHPCVILNDPERQMGVALKLTPAEFQKGDLPQLINRIAKEWKKVYPDETFDYSFLGDSIEKMYESQQQTKWLMQTATLITIFISCMGLFGLTMFATERRTKEISIRKTMGATVPHILTMLNKEVVVLIAISLLMASPIAWFFVHQWLQNFAYHTSLSFWIFILAGAGAMLIALATISFQTISSATANPVKGLRNE